MIFIDECCGACDCLILWSLMNDADIDVWLLWVWMGMRMQMQMQMRMQMRIIDAIGGGGGEFFLSGRPYCHDEFYCWFRFLPPMMLHFPHLRRSQRDWDW